MADEDQIPYSSEIKDVVRYALYTSRPENPFHLDEQQLRMSQQILKFVHDAPTEERAKWEVYAFKAYDGRLLPAEIKASSDEELKGYYFLSKLYFTHLYYRKYCEVISLDTFLGSDESRYVVKGAARMMEANPDLQNKLFYHCVQAVIMRDYRRAPDSSTSQQENKHMLDHLINRTAETLTKATPAEVKVMHYAIQDWGISDVTPQDVSELKKRGIEVNRCIGMDLVEKLRNVHDLDGKVDSVCQFLKSMTALAPLDELLSYCSRSSPQEINETTDLLFHARFHKRKNDRKVMIFHMRNNPVLKACYEQLSSQEQECFVSHYSMPKTSPRIVQISLDDVLHPIPENFLLNTLITSNRGFDGSEQSIQQRTVAHAKGAHPVQAFVECLLKE
ncbi:hypothetical protein HZB02_03810 [Candidatus Woesearchaeota archaeon]|nr:hypothetical protein [Candidatus Woesearchaeota archaeon]